MQVSHPLVSGGAKPVATEADVPTAANAAPSWSIATTLFQKCEKLSRVQVIPAAEHEAVHDWPAVPSTVVGAGVGCGAALELRLRFDKISAELV